MSFWDVLGVDPGSTTAQLRKAYGTCSLRYHPDKGGDQETFKFITMVYNVLKTPELRQKYDEQGKDPFVGSYRSQPGTKMTAPPVPINVDFLKELMLMQGAHTYKIGGVPLWEYLEEAMATKGKSAVYQECALAEKLNMKLRLTSTGKMSVYPMPRVVRFAALMGRSVVEIDAPASHGQQVYKYASRHGLPCSWLGQAFGSPDNIVEFRSRSIGGLKPSEVKQCLNLLCYGNGLKEWLHARHMTSLPEEIAAVKREMGAVRKHMVANASAAVHDAVSCRQHPELTIMSIEASLPQ